MPLGFFPKYLYIYMGQFPQDGENGQNVEFLYFFGAVLWPNGFTFSTFLNCFEEILPLVLAHLDPELELFEVWEIMVGQITITIIAWKNWLEKVHHQR